MTGSLKKRLIWILLALTLFAWVTSALVTYLYASRVLLAQVDRQLEQYSVLVNYITDVFARQLDGGQPLYERWRRYDVGQTEHRPIIIDTPNPAGLTPAVNIWERGVMIALVEGSPVFDEPAVEGFSFRDLADEQSQWRMLSRYDSANDLWITVAIELGAARGAMRETLGQALLPLLLVLPLMILVLYLGVSRGLKPLRSLAGQISRRKPGALDPVDTADVPGEVAGVVDSLNALLERLAYALEGEQRFTANAAHELMTPLAAIKLEVQLCQRQLNEGPGADMLARIDQRVDRASHTVEQLLAMARVDPDATLPMEAVGLRALVDEVLAEVSHLLAAQELEVVVNVGEEVTVDGCTEWLAILMRNLVVNAIRYATPKTKIEIEIEIEVTGVPKLTIRNDCAPLSTAEFDQMADRFYRVPGSAGQGAGLGLSIVARVAQLHHAELQIGPGSEGRGFSVELCFSET